MTPDDLEPLSADLKALLDAEKPIGAAPAGAKARLMSRLSTELFDAPGGDGGSSQGGGGVLDVPIGSLVRVRLSANALVQPRVTLAIGGVPVWASGQFAFTALASLHFKLWGDVVP